MPYMGREEWAEEKRESGRGNFVGIPLAVDSEHAFLKVILGYGVYKRSF